MDATISSWSAVSSSVMMRTASSVLSKTSAAVKEKDSLTEAYLPDFFLAKDLTPRTSELLILGLKHRDKLLNLTNLDAGGISEAQVALVETLRAQRQLEAQLPPVTDAFSLGIRTKKMEVAEFASWRRRECQMAEVNAKRLSLVKEVLQKYLKEHVYARIEKKLTLVRGHKDAETTKYVLTAERTRNKIIRKLRAMQLKTLQTVNGLGTVGKEKELNKLRLLEKLDCFKVIEAAEHQTKFKPLFEVEVQDLKTVEGLNSIDLPKRKTVFNAPPEVTTAANKDKLTAALRLIKTEINWRARAKAQAVINKAAGMSADALGLTATSGEGGKEETPRFPRPRSVDADEAESFRVLRGLERQAEMEASLETRKLLIAELRAAEKETTLIYSDETLEAVEGTIGEVVSQALDDLSKELVRLQEEQRLAVAVFAIVRERRMKEAEEAGRRQHEELRRDREDEIFRQIMEVNRGTVTSYIEDIIGRTIDNMVVEIPAEDEKAEAGIADVVVDVVKNFLFPHIDRGEVHRKLVDKRTAVSRAAVAALNVLVDQIIML
jgi:hypothetical protein